MFLVKGHRDCLTTFGNTIFFPSGLSPTHGGRGSSIAQHSYYSPEKIANRVEKIGEWNFMAVFSSLKSPLQHIGSPQKSPDWLFFPGPAKFCKFYANHWIAIWSCISIDTVLIIQRSLNFIRMGSQHIREVRRYLREWWVRRRTM